MLENEGYQLMGAAFEVYNELGYDMAEEIYQQSLEIELALRQIPFQTKRELQVFYKDNLLNHLQTRSSGLECDRCGTQSHLRHIP
jgi:GxxExxY protein